MMSKILVSIAAGGICLAGAFAADTASPAAYSLELDAELRPGEDFFPLGILGGGRFDLLPQMGFNLSEHGHCCYPFKEGRSCDLEHFGAPQNGLYFPAIWAAHTLWHGGETAGYGPVRRPLTPDGREEGGPFMDYHEKAMRDYVKAAAAASVEHVLDNGDRKVWAWGIDNEWEPPLNYSPAAKDDFRAWLEAEWAGDLDGLNALWRTGYASFAEVEPPAPAEYRDRPAAWLAWRRFSEEAYADFVAEYFQAIQEADPARRPVLSKSTQCTIEMTFVARNRINNHMLLAEKTRPYSRGWFCIDMYGHNDRDAYEASYLWNCIRPTDRQKGEGAPEGRVFAAEANNHSGPGYQFAQTFWRYLANGVRGFDFFVLGKFRAVNDFATFSFIDAYDGQPRDRMFYLARFAGMIHRSEAFWSTALPAKETPRLAILMPQRDVMLSQDTNRSWWDYGVNDRLGIFRRLRDAGYWVDVIPYSKLESDYLSRYQALLLISAEHLSGNECDAIAEFVEKGGVLLCDTQPGYFDERHRVVNGLDELLGIRIKGVYTGIHFSPDDLWYANRDGFVLRCDGRITAELAGAELLNRIDTLRNAKCAWVTANRVGEGMAYWFGTRLGTLRAESAPDGAVTDFLTSFLQAAGVAPAYRAPGVPGDNLRVEAPLTDGKGNLVVALAANTGVALEPFELILPLPGAADIREVWWGSAENTRLEAVSFERDPEGLFRIAMPGIASAGMLYFLHDHPPMLGIGVEGEYEAAKNDCNTPSLAPGRSYPVAVTIADPAGFGYAGTLELAVQPGWKVEPAVQPVSEGRREYRFTVTPAAPGADSKPAFLYPLAATLSNEEGRVAVGSANVMLEWDTALYPSVLTDNPPQEHSLSGSVLRTEATYRYILPDGSELKDGSEIRDPRDAVATNGLPALNYGVIGEWGQTADVLFRGIPRMTVEFDLKARYLLDQLRLARGTMDSLERVAVSTSEDGREFTEPRELDSAAVGTQLSSFPLGGVSARYVRIDLVFRGDAGTFGEVEITGRTPE